MSTATPAKLKSLRALLITKPHQEVLRMYLQKSEIGLLKDAILVTLHRKWSAHPPYHLTELGITTYDRQRVNNGQPTLAGPQAENLFKHVWCLHLRIRPNAHLPSASGDPNAYHFGTTVYVSQEEAMGMLHDIWHQPMDETYSRGFRPIVYMSFGDNDGVGKVRKEAFGFDPSSVDTTVAVLDAQYIAVQAKITSSTTAPLEYILRQFKIKPFDVDNGGNAAMYTTVVAILSTLRKELYTSAENPRAKAGQKGQSTSKSAQSVMQWLMEWPTPAPPYGVPIYCWRCGSAAHSFAECPNSDLECSKCTNSPHAWRKANAGTHMEGLCVFRRMHW